MSFPVKLCLAPMAGVADKAFRLIASEFGADLTVSEMISIKGLYYNDKKTAQLLENPENCTSSVQLFGHEPDIFGAVVPKALEYGAHYLDINCGCPAKKIISNGDGSALMKNPGLIGEIVSAAVKASSVPVSVKLRLGWDENSKNAAECAKIACENGASFIAVHGRTTAQGYSGTADLDGIREVVRSVNVPVIGNGDIKTCADAKKMLDYTGCAGIMVGRAALGNIYFIKQLSHYIKTGEELPPQTDLERLSLAKRHIGLIVKYKGEQNGIKEARKHALWYVKGMKNNVRYKDGLVRAKTYGEMCGVLDALADTL